MAEDPEREENKPGQPTIFNSDIGDDWGEAFEADIQATPKADATSDFFLPEAAGEPTVGPAPADHKEAGGEGHRGLLHLSQGLWARLGEVPLPLRLLILGGPVFLGLALFLFVHHSQTSPRDIKAPPPAAQRVAKAPKPQATPVRPGGPAVASATPSAKVVAPPEQPLGGDLILRKKWRIPALLIHAEGGKGEGSILILNDLTLVLKLAPEVMPPDDKGTLIRETIYQFYLNQPPDDLRRYALDRGALSSRLKAWVLKQWPGLPLDSITVDRYQIL